MKAIPRERIALVVFIACIAFMAVGISAYMVAGHSWNYAASRIDDATGEMDDYRIVLFEGTGVPARSQVDAEDLLKSHPVSLAQARSSYAAKGATVFTLDSMNLQRYSVPMVSERDGYRLGFVYLDADCTRKDAQEHADYLLAHGCRAVIAFSDGFSPGNAKGIDIIIDMDTRRVVPGAGNSNDAFRVQMPAVGSVGAIVISPSEVVSARTISSL